LPVTTNAYLPLRVFSELQYGMVPVRLARFKWLHVSHADIPKALRVFKQAGVGKPPIKGDELPPRKK
jgi:hypothetical protein